MYFNNQKLSMIGGKKALFIAFLVFFSISNVVLGATFNPDPFNGHWLNDTYADSGTPAVNHYDSASNAIENASDTTVSYLAVDLTDLDPDDIIFNASLNLHGSSCSGGVGDQGRIIIHDVTSDPVAYSGITWNNQPCDTGFDNAGNCNLTASYVSSGYECGNWTGADVSFDITELVKMNLGDTMTLALRNELLFGSGNSLSWTSDDGSGASSDDPHINITYSVGGHGTPVYQCGVINTAGEYYLNTSFTADTATCIHINTSNVKFDLHGMTLTGNNTILGGANYGVLVYQSGATLQNVTVEGENGVITGFDWGIWGGNLDGFGVNNMTIKNNDVGLFVGSVGIQTNANYSYVRYINFTYNAETDLEIDMGYFMDISNNDFDNFGVGSYNMEINDLENSTVAQNDLGTLSVIADQCSTDQSSYFGFCFTPSLPYVICSINWNATTCVGGTYTGYGAGYGIYCNDCFNNYFIANSMYAVKDMVVTGDSYGNVISLNTYLAKPSIYNGLYLQSDTHDNTGCGNEGNIIDEGDSNDFEAVCSEAVGGIMTAGYYCQNDDVVFVTSSASILNTTDCGSSGCVSDGNTSYCANAVTQTDSTDSLLNIGDYIGGFVWIDMIFTPFFLATLFMLGVSGYFALRFKESAGTVFVITISVMALAFVYLGIYPVSIGYFIGLMIIFVAMSFIQKSGWLSGGGGGG